jgi:hypothetical protein
MPSTCSGRVPVRARSSRVVATTAAHQSSGSCSLVVSAA